ncbi:MAG TPA: hypothetical protein VN841_25620 [Bryobacteraceae bacterium]|nr:hypothetical protein [Bryobacteraceae bacterium]
MRSQRLFILFALLSTGARAQWLHYPTPGIPRTRDGKPNLSAPAPRASNGKPDLSGIWQVEPTPFDEMTRLFGPGLETLSVPGDDLRTFSKYAISILADFKPEEAPIRFGAAKIAQGRFENFGIENPTTQCLPGGVPFGGLLPFPNKFIQTPGVIVILQEADGAERQIFTDGRKHTAEPQPSWMGYSVGKWEGDALIVDTVGFNDKGWLDAFGHPRSEALRVQERYRRRDFGHLDVQVTLDDPKMYTRPFSIKYTLDLVPNTDIGEYVCAENEKDRPHLGKQ